MEFGEWQVPGDGESRKIIYIIGLKTSILYGTMHENL
jgi:hypothetical protein